MPNWLIWVLRLMVLAEIVFMVWFFGFVMRDGFKEGHREYNICEPECKAMSQKINMPILRIELIKDGCECRFYSRTYHKW